MENLKELSKNELQSIEGGNWIYDLFYAFGVGCVKEAKYAGSVSGMKYGGAWQG